ncbi:unnamed protein product [Rotaria magnacalcarata]|uniref:Uncharacterized protein n=1 Tax=Rotaria magnacalcarata TaxID=392030 RepID=A0A818ZUC7_9BILA|nr:unnamed protein product [Rotaria magnacalcarata]CAF3774929.1 unnamed protein product [Rotaria magnacalcarata]
MNTRLYDQNSSANIIRIPEILSIGNKNDLSSTKIEYIDMIVDENYPPDDLVINPIDYHGNTPSMLNKKQKSLISIYDNNPQQQQQQQLSSYQQQSTTSFHPLVGIIGRSKRSEAFTKRLLLSGFPKPILCDINSNEIDLNYKSNYVSYENFYELSPTIVLITDNLTRNLDDLFPQNKSQIIIDARQIYIKYSSKKSSRSLLSIPGSYRAFGNLSNWEITNGTQRIAVTIEQYPPLNLVKFIFDLNCFPRGIHFLDQYSYNKQQRKSFRNCLFPFLSIIVIFSLCFIVSMMEHNHDIFTSVLIYRQASSITASTSILLLALLFFIRPILELIEFIYLMILKKQSIHENVISKFTFIQCWLQSRHYLVWYSLLFALLHVLFLIFSKIDFNSKLFTCGFFFGIFTLLVLFILSYAHFPWISEHLLWNEYRLLTSFVGTCCLLLAFIHIFLHWKFNSDLFNLKLLSMIILFIVLILRLIIYGIIHSSFKLIQYIRTRSMETSLL